MRQKLGLFTRVTVLAGIAAGATAIPVSATVTSTTPQAVKVAPPASVELDAYESDTEMRVFDERQDIALAANLAVDITIPGLYDETADLTPGVIPAGTVVSSHLVHVDVVGDGPRIVFQGGLVVDQDIIGIIVTKRNLDRSDAALGAPGTDYPESTDDSGRGLNLASDDQEDALFEFNDRRTVDIIANGGVHMDQVRIVTKKHVDGGEGCTPGYWKQKQHFDSWSGFTQNQSFEAVFGVNAFPGDPSLLTVLGMGGGGVNALGRHAVAALLNSNTIGSKYTTGQVISMVQQAIANGTVEQTKDLLAAANERRCPLN